jgi:hypothetical protein
MVWRMEENAHCVGALSRIGGHLFRRGEEEAAENVTKYA